MRVNTPENTIPTFCEALETLLQELIDTLFKFYKQVNANPGFIHMLTEFLFERYRKLLSVENG
jgi:hypothetical protein